MKNKILKETLIHAPFTAIASIIAVVSTLIIFYFKNSLIQEISSSFEFLHYLHILAAAIVASALFYKYKKNIFLSFLVGIISSIAIGSISDIIFPYLGGNLINLKLSFHLPIIEEPIIILAVAIIGVILGTALQITKIPHAIHVFISVFASLLYILKYTQNLTLLAFAGILIITFLAVIIPCCIGDIIFPMLLNFKEKNNLE